MYSYKDTALINTTTIDIQAHTVRKFGLGVLFAGTTQGVVAKHNPEDAYDYNCVHCIYVIIVTICDWT